MYTFLALLQAPPDYPRFPMRRFLDQSPFDSLFASDSAHRSVWAQMTNAFLSNVQPWFSADASEWVDVSTIPTYVIGRSMTESSVLPSLWTRRVLERVDEVWAPSPHSRDAFIDAGVPENRVWMLEEPIDPSAYDPAMVEPLWDTSADPVDASRMPRLIPVASSSSPFRLLRAPGSFNFLSVFKWERRKGWELLVRAFVEEFSDNDAVTLTIHTHVPSEDAETRVMQHDAEKQAEYVVAAIRRYVEESEELGARRLERSNRPLPLSRILIHTDSISLPSMPSLYASFSAFVLPTHGEGWGLPLMESMAMALPTCATGWGGQLAFMKPDNSFLIEVERMEEANLEQIADGDDIPMWAVASVPHLRRILRQMVSSPADAAAVGAIARASIVSHFTGSQLAARIVDRLATHVWPVLLQREAASAQPRLIQEAKELTPT
jgi:glycosyltransferase involved in cell wall biosynthesis